MVRCPGLSVTHSPIFPALEMGNGSGISSQVKPRMAWEREAAWDTPTSPDSPDRSRSRELHLSAGTGHAPGSKYEFITPTYPGPA